MTRQARDLDNHKFRRFKTGDTQSVTLSGAAQTVGPFRDTCRLVEVLIVGQPAYIRQDGQDATASNRYLLPDTPYEIAVPEGGTLSVLQAGTAGLLRATELL